MRFLKQQIDRWAIRAAAKLLPERPPRPGQLREIEALLADPQLFVPEETIPTVLLAEDFTFQFNSTVHTWYQPNNVVRGRIFPAGTEWRNKPTVIMVHGWNAEMHYAAILPNVARELNKRGMNGVLMELPYHLHRRPPREERISNFISEDLPRMLEATRQAIADLNALILWLKSVESPSVATWGFSLGGWLVGLHLCLSAAQNAAVLTTPVSDMARAIGELSFCHPIRAALAMAPVSLDILNLSERMPKIPPGRIRLEQANYDVFVPAETYRQLAAAWRLSQWECVPQSHITILVSKKAVRSTANWLAGTLV